MLDLDVKGGKVSDFRYRLLPVFANLLKADAAVDLVHFTILRPPEKQDGTPINELSLIAFPTRELFQQKIKDFQLIIFDRYESGNLITRDYFRNIAEYVKGGGALLVSVGPVFATQRSLYRTPLGAILLALGALGWLDFRLNIFLNVMTPLIMVISFADSMQLTFAARDRLIAAFDLDITQHDYALGYRFDVVLRGRNATPMGI